MRGAQSPFLTPPPPRARGALSTVRRQRFEGLRGRLAAALLLLPCLFAAQQAAGQATLTNVQVNFETGRFSWSGTCFDSFQTSYRFGTSGAWTNEWLPFGFTQLAQTRTAIVGQPYVEARVRISPDSGCGSAFYSNVVYYNATTLSSSPASLSEGNLNGATLTVTLGDDETTRTPGASTPETFVSGAAASHFTLSTNNITGLSIGSVTPSTGNRTATVTLAFDSSAGEVGAAATVAVVVDAAAHSGSNTLTSLPRSVAASPGFSINPESLLLDEDSAGLALDRDAYTVGIKTQPDSTCTNGVVVSVASDNTDVAVSAAALTFTDTNWTNFQTVDVTATADADSTTDTATLSHTVSTACGSDYPTSLTIDSVSVTVRDDDRRVVVSPTELAVTEGGTGTYTVVLSGAPTANVTVTATSPNPAVTVGTRDLTFTTSNWNTPQTMTVTGETDADAVDEVSTITNTATALWQSRSVRVTVADDEETGTDYDTDDDGLIEITTLARLNAMRWDLDGDGAADSSTNMTSYASAFSGAAATMGCPDDEDADQDAACVGYELMANLTFDTNDDGVVDADDPGSYPNWTPIGGRYTAIFEGNGNTISDLTVNASGGAGLFGHMDGRVEGLGLLDVSVYSNNGRAGAFADIVSGQIIACWSTGSVGTRGLGGGPIRWRLGWPSDRAQCAGGGQLLHRQCQYPGYRRRRTGWGGK